MKQFTFLLIAASAFVVLSSCKEKKPSEEIIVTKYVVKAPEAPIKMSVDKRENQVEWMGKPYTVVVERMPSDSLPMVKDEDGQLYVDNRVSLKVIRGDGSVFCTKTFTKASFASYLDDDYRATGILGSFWFTEADDQELEFAVCVNHPQSDDEFIPLKLTLDRQGGISIKRDSDLDINGGSNDDEGV